MFSKFQVWIQKTLPILPGLHGLDGLLEVLRRPLLGADRHDLVVLPRGGDHRLALGDVVADGLLAVDVLAGHHGVDRRQGVPVVGRGDDDGVDVLAVEQLAIVLDGLGVDAPGLLHLRGGLGGVAVVDVGRGDELDLLVREEGLHHVVAAVARADQGEPDLLVGPQDRAARRQHGGRAGGGPDELPARDVSGAHGCRSRRWIGGVFGKTGSDPDGNEGAGGSPGGERRSVFALGRMSDPETLPHKGGGGRRRVLEEGTKQP